VIGYIVKATFLNMSDIPSVVVEEYDARWAESFTALAARVKRALGDRVLRIEHVGSTAVTGLAAKPIIDLDVVVLPANMHEAIQGLARLGYVYEGDLGIAGREAFRWPPGERRHHLYLLAEGAPELLRHLAFRDALRTDRDLRDEYATLKRSLAARYPHDRDAYSAGKSAFIERTLADR
jgi:GrpB-like predicted nucleotidyltransferase (UPF0157 family)